MSGGRRVSAASFIAAAFVVCGFCVAASPGRAADDIGARFLLFSGSDIWRNGAFAHGGLPVAPGGLDQDGFNFKLVLSGGRYRYNSGSLGGETVIGAETRVEAMPGWRIKRGDLEVKVFVGLDAENHRLSPDDPSSRLRGRSTGLRAAFDLWYNPTPMTMLAMDGSLSSIAANQSARLAYGWRVFDAFYVGPETQFFGSDGYRHLRLGAHVTGFKTGNYEWSAAGGWAGDSDRRSSPYVRLGVLMRQ